MKIHPSLISTLTGLIMVCGLLVACGGDEPVKGFVLPAGDAEHGKEVFIAFNCLGCHDVAGVDLPERTNKPPFVIQLGGEVVRVKDYGELLTAVVNPEHVISPKYQTMLMTLGKDPKQSPMPRFDDVMTVTELIDLVEFLHGQYTKTAPNYYRGHYYQSDLRRAKK